GNAADGALFGTRAHAICALDVRNELAQKKVAVAHRSVSGVDIKTAAAFGRNNEKLPDCVLAAQIVEQGPASAMEQSLFVVAEAVQKIQHGIARRRLRVGVTCGQVDTEMDDLLENLAVHGVAVDAAL